MLANVLLRRLKDKLFKLNHLIDKGLFSHAVRCFPLRFSSEMQCRAPLTKSHVWQPPVRAFMDDLTVTITSVPPCRYIVQQQINWVRTDFKATKSLSLVKMKWKVMDKFQFSLGDILIPSVLDKPVKSLRKLYDAILRDKAAIQVTSRELGTWLVALYK